MYTSEDPGRLWMLYDTARGFVGLRKLPDIMRQTLLSLMGCCGTSFAAYLHATGDGRFELKHGRGVRDDLEIRARLSARAVRGLVESPVHAQSDVLELGPDFRRLHDREEIRFVGAVVTGGTVAGLVLLGPRLLGEPYAEPEVSMAAEIIELCALALPGRATPGVASDGSRRGRVSERITALRGERPALGRIRGEGARTLELYEELVALSEFDLPVLVRGETGTGKELVARAIHDLSPRGAHPFEAINCAAIPTELVASALFGHERGAFTGAVATARGVFERAGEGTVFLDEIGDMPLETQVSLLRVLQERSFRRVGGEAMLPARARVISATNSDLVDAVTAGTFRADLFYRIQMYTIQTLPLRDRPEDIAEIVRHVLDRAATGRRVPEVTPSFIEALCARELPGNVRELEGLVLGALVRARGRDELLPEHLSADDVSRALGARPPRPVLAEPLRYETPTPEIDREHVPSYEDMERKYIRSVLELTGGNKKDAAALMKIPRTTLNARIKKLEIEV